MPYTLEQWHTMGRLENVGAHRLFVVDNRPDPSPLPVPVLLLIHGFPTASWDWHMAWDALTTKYRVIAPDMLGFGFSDKPRRHDYRIMEQADLIESVLDVRGVDNVHVLAHDYGDTVAQELLARDADSARFRVGIDSVCLLNGGLFPETHRARAIQKLLLGPAGPVLVRLMRRGSLERNMRAVFGTATPPKPDELENFWTLVNHNDGRLVMHRLMRYIEDRLVHRERWVNALQVARHKVCLINGSADPISGAHMVARYRELVGTDGIVELPDIGHYPQLEAPLPVIEHAMGFFDKMHANGPMP